MQRSLSGTYKYGHIYDNTNPLPNNERLRATRTICKSPFTQDQNAVYYFGGYDCAQDTSNNTSWIYKGVLASPQIGIDETYFVNSLTIYPNPTNTILFIKSENNNPLNFQILNSIGQVVQQEKIKGNSINVSSLLNGIYIIRFFDNENQSSIYKFIKN
jgi:hypothetical protein